jgi:hypothetical protein
MIYERGARGGPRIASEDVVSLLIGILILGIEGILTARGVLPPFWH